MATRGSGLVVLRKVVLAHEPVESDWEGIPEVGVVGL